MGRPRSPILLALAALVLSAACAPRDAGPIAWTEPAGVDPHTLSRPHEVVVTHMDLDLTLDFEARTIDGIASLTIDNRTGAESVWLDTWKLDVRRVRLDDSEADASFALGESAGDIGRALAVQIGPDTRTVHIEYGTSPEATALQWLEPRQTTGGEQPFLLTQSQSIYARTWIPCQDTPAVRSTYAATVRVPRGLMALMSAENPRKPSPDGVYRFEMRHPIPAYLLALAVGELEFRELGPRTGVYAEPAVVERAAWEFAETERMMEAAERLYGPYRWERYDMIVLPASFPFGGMENPMLSFITPTLLAGDRSLVTTVAHELAHSWSGNLVTNASWGEIWLNEGFTVYCEQRIMEELHGRDYAEMLALLSLQDLRQVLDEKGHASPDTHLQLDLGGRHPDEGFSDVAYHKGYMFLRMLEEQLGRETWDEFLRGYFDTFAFRSMTSDRFLSHLREKLVEGRPDAAELEASLQLEAWVHGPGLPSNVSEIHSAAFDEVDARFAAWFAGTPASKLETDGWTTQQMLHFVRHLSGDAPLRRLRELDETFRFSESRNSEILHAWLMKTVGRRYGPSEAAVRRFLTGMGRIKFLHPLYAELSRSPEGMERARTIYETARPGYHAVSTEAIDQILGWPW